MHSLLMLGAVAATLAPTQRPQRTTQEARVAEAPQPVIAVAYEQMAVGVSTMDLASTLRTLAEEARRENALSFEEHRVPLHPEIELKESHVEWSRPGYRRYSFSIDLKLGGGHLRKSQEQHNASLWKHELLGFRERSGVTAQDLAEYFERLAADLDDGFLSFEGRRLELGEMIDLGVYHTVGDHKGVAGVQFSIQFGEMLPEEHRSRVSRQNRYHRESESLPVHVVGEIIERLGREIREGGRVMLSGSELAVGGKASLELVSHEDGTGRTGLQLEFLTDPDGPSNTKSFFVPYERRSHGWAPADVARAIGTVADTLARTGRFVLEDDTVALDGLGSVEQKLVTQFEPGTRRYASYLSISFGPEHIPTPLPEYVEEIAPQEVLAKDETKNADGPALGALLQTVARDLEAGRVRMGGQELDIGEEVDFRFKHTSSPDGRSHRIQLALFFGERTSAEDQARGTRPRSHARESRDMPLAEIGALLQRLGTEILSDGRFSLGGSVFHPAEKAFLEIKVLEGRGLDISVRYRPPILIP